MNSHRLKRTLTMLSLVPLIILKVLFVWEVFPKLWYLSQHADLELLILYSMGGVLLVAAVTVADCFVAYKLMFAWPPRRDLMWTAMFLFSLLANPVLALAGKNMMVAKVAPAYIMSLSFPAYILSWIYIVLVVSLNMSLNTGSRNISMDPRNMTAFRRRRYLQRMLMFCTLMALILGKAYLVRVLYNDWNTPHSPSGYVQPDPAADRFFVAIISILSVVAVVDIFVLRGITYAWPPKRFRIWTSICGFSLITNLLLPLAGIFLMCLAAGLGSTQNHSFPIMCLMIAEAVAWVYAGLAVSLWLVLKEQPTGLPVIQQSTSIEV